MFIKDDIEFIKIIFHFFADAGKTKWTAIAISGSLAILYFRIFFPRRSGFNDTSEDYTQGPDYGWFKIKVVGIILISVGGGMLAYYQLPDWFPNFFK